MSIKNWCPVCPGLGQGILKFFTDLKYFFSKDFFKERYYLHFSLSIPISFGIVLFFREFMYLGDTPVWFQLFIGGAALFAINGIREAILENEEKGIKFSWSDIFFGTYGGIVGAWLVTLIF